MSTEEVAKLGSSDAAAWEKLDGELREKWRYMVRHYVKDDDQAEELLSNLLLSLVVALCPVTAPADPQ